MTRQIYIKQDDPDGRFRKGEIAKVVITYDHGEKYDILVELPDMVDFATRFKPAELDKLVVYKRMYMFKNSEVADVPKESS